MILNLEREEAKKELPNFKILRICQKMNALMSLVTEVFQMLPDKLISIFMFIYTKRIQNIPIWLIIALLLLLFTTYATF